MSAAFPKSVRTKIKKAVWVFLLTLWLAPFAYAEPSPRMLPQVYSGGQDISGWLMSEKLDGVRGHWDGRQFWSKNGKPLHPPAAFTEGLPDFALEGELWGGRGSFEGTAGTVLRQKAHDGWLKLKFAIFDVPNEAEGFRRRIEKARAWFSAHPSRFAFVIPQVPVVNREHLQQELQRVEALGGEGLIVRDPDALYAAGRSAQVLKVKSFQDAEGVVIGHTPGQGENLGRLGSLVVELADGTRFKIGTGLSDAQRQSPPPIGAVVTFKYYGRYQSGIPKFPSFLRIRTDQGL